MGLREHGGQQAISFESSEATILPAEHSEPLLSDGHYYAKLIMQEGPNTYFCPRCGGLQHTEYMCANCEKNYPTEVIHLNADSFAQYANLIRQANPLTRS